MTTKAVEDYTGREFIITRTFDAPRALVFQAWTDPKHLAQWWGPRGFTNPVCEWDVRVGGKIYDVMRAPNGMDFPMGGEFREIVAPERLVFMCGALNDKGEMLFEFLHTAVFTEQKGKTLLTLNSRVLKVTAEANKYIGGFQAGMTQSLEKLTELLAAPDNTTDREIVITRVVGAPHELVWDAMTDPKHVIHWWGPRGFSTTIEIMDARPGGEWKHVMQGPDGVKYPNHSVFKEVARPERLVYTHGGHREGGPGVNFLSTWTFDEVEPGKTRVTIRMVFPTAAERDFVVKEFGAIEGGKQTLERLGEFIAREPVVVERTFNAPVDMVWQAITDPAHMKQWYFSTLETFKAELGFETRVDVSHEGKVYMHLWKVTEVVAGKKIAYTWKYVGYPGESLLTMELVAEGRKTRLKLTHSGLETFLPEINPHLARGNFVMGWAHYLGEALGAFLEKAAFPDDRAVVITRTFDAPRELVWRAWTDPKQMAQWWGPRGFTNPVCEMDVQPGGTWRVVMRSPEGEEFPLKSTFVKVEPPERLVLVMDCSEHPVEWHDMVNPNRDKSKKPRLECVQIITFEEVGGKTKLTIRTELETSAIRDAMVKMGMHEGWSGSLDKLTECLAQSA